MAKDESSESPSEAVAEEQKQPAATTPTDDLVSTQHVLSIGRKKLKYTATTGRIVLRQEVLTEGKFDGHRPKAEVFLTAYTLDGADAADRPVTFAFNGGPGSSSVWLHLGLLGPRRVVSGDAGDLAPPPYGLVDNPESLLQHSDLVFIDPVSTGYSRAVEGEKPGDYHGFTGDLESVGEVIRLWTSRNGRWMSPKFLAGESYGTTRAAGLAAHLQERLRHVPERGDADLGGARVRHARVHAGQRPAVHAVPAVVRRHRALPRSRRTSRCAEVLADAEGSRPGGYPYALAQGNRIPADDRAEVVTRLATLTGLSEDYVDRVDLRIEHMRFFAELLRSRRQVVGRLDGRFTGWDADYAGETPGKDPSFSAIIGPYTAALNHYVRAELEYENDLPYEILNMDAAKAWSFKEFEGQHDHRRRQAGRRDAGQPAPQGPRRVRPLRRRHAVLRHRAHARPSADPGRAGRQHRDEYYPAGHMMYVHEESRVQQSEDLAAFIRSASNR